MKSEKNDCGHQRCMNIHSTLMIDSRYKFCEGIPVVLTRHALHYHGRILLIDFSYSLDIAVKYVYLNSTFTYFFLPRRSTKSSLLMSSGV